MELKDNQWLHLYAEFALFSHSGDDLVRITYYLVFDVCLLGWAKQYTQ